MTTKDQKRHKKFLRQDTPMLKQHEVQRDWIEIDATGKTLGRLASQIAMALRGKHRPDYTPHVDSGAGVIVKNADKVRVTGFKEARKFYHWHSGYIGGLRTFSYREMHQRKPEYILYHAVKGMLPKTKQGRAQLKRLRLYLGNEHKHEAQQPVEVKF